MRQLSALDAQFLNAESETTAAHVAGLAILDPAGGSISRQSLADLLLERRHLSPALSLRLVQVPLGLDRPYWAHDPDFDLEHHLFEQTLPAPGGMGQLADAVAEIHARRLDRAHPLWEMHLIHGLADGTVAVYTKVHHAAIDGVSGAETLAALLDLAPGRPDLLKTPEIPNEVRDGTDRRHEKAKTDGNPRTDADLRADADARTDGEAKADGDAGTDGDPRSDEASRGGLGDTGAPSFLEMLSGAAVQAATQPVRTLRSMIRMAGELDAIPLAARVPGARLIAEAARVAGGDLEPRPEPPSLAVPRTPFNGPISAERRFAFGSVSYKDVRNVAKANESASTT